MENKLYQTLIEQFSMYDLKDLQEILDDEESSEEAVKAAEYILSGKSVEREKYQSEVKKQEQLIKEKQDNIISNPLYDDLHQLAGDIRFIKNIIIVGIIFEIVNVIIALL